ncbi:hypothetical protein MMC29_004277 [Sticta canariensis]|nr:hypothetical protein [Sticta canariensis]
MAEGTIRDAFEKLKSSISSDDARDFHSTTLNDVRSAARAIQDAQASRQSLQNLRRIEPFLKFTEKYSTILEVICQGFSPMAWVWGPLKLMIQLASQYGNVFDKLLEAYKQLAEELPRVDRLRKVFIDDQGFQTVLSLLYADIVEFHQRAYKFFRRRAWYMFFECTWRSFEQRFQGILSNLRRHASLMDKEAASIHFLEAKEAAQRMKQEIDEKERQRQAFELREVLQWVTANPDQEQRLERLWYHRQGNTCEWLLRNENIVSWLHEGPSKPIIWLNGIPGSGKSILCSRLVDHLQEQQKVSFGYYFCRFSPTGADTCVEVLRAMVAQLVKSQPDMLPHIHQNYVDKALNPSLKVMKELLAQVLSGLPSSRIILDGVDECHETQQKEILSTLLPLQKNAPNSCKLLISSRVDEGYIKSVLRQKPSIRLKDHNSEAISLFVDQNVAELSDIFDSLEDDLLDRIRRELCFKAGGMFLWVRLVIDNLRSQTTARELENSLEKLPEGLEEAYDRILDRIKSQMSTSQRDQTLRLLHWISCAYRPLKLYELEDGVAFHCDQCIPGPRDRIQRSIVSLCGPLVEELPGGIIETVHFSAKEFILSSTSGPFIDRRTAHGTISFSCISYLNSRLKMIPNLFPSITEESLECHVIRGYNGLEQYAHKFWLNHTLAYLSGGGVESIGASANFLKALQDFASFSKKISSSSSSGSPDSAVQPQTVNDSHIQLSVLDKLPEVHGLLKQVLVFHKKMKEAEDRLESAECEQRYFYKSRTTPLLTQNVARLEWHSKHDPTYLSYVKGRVSEIIQRLQGMKDADVPGHINVEELHRFQKLYNALGFHCRYLTCTCPSAVFASEQQRQQHESTHIRLYKCLDCDFSARGFTSSAKLRKHREKYHMRPEDFNIPQQIMNRYTPAITKTSASESLLEDDFDLDALLQSTDNGFNREAVSYYGYVPAVLSLS